MATNIVGGERRFPDIVANNYTDLSTNFNPALYTGQYAEVLNGQSGGWIPGWLGGTYYSKGFYKSNGVTWEYIGSFPYQATQAQVDAGTNNDRFVTPSTLKNASQWDTKLNVADLPTTLIFYPTTAASSITGYTRLVTDINDPDFDSPAVDVATGPITTTNQLVAELATDAGILIGNPGVVNMVITGNIRRTTNNGSGDFYYEVYHRDNVGTETLISTSSNTANVINMTYEQFYAPALINNGTFTATDRLVFKFYGNKTSSATPEYELQFGGTQPVRASFPVPFNVLPISGGGGTWGSIIGTLSAQTDLQTALDAKQDNAVVVSTNQVAANNANYHVIANATFTDPTGVDGRGYRVFVRAGVATINSVAYSSGTTILRIFDGGTWVSYVNSGTNTGDNFILSGSPVQSNAATGGSPRYYGFSDNTNAIVEINRRVLLPKTCTLRNFYLRTSGTQPASGSHVFTILKNGVATAITLTVPAGSAAGLFSDTTNQETFIAGDEISIEAVNNASATSSIVVSFSIGVA
jgi:hypothetical protein